MTEETNRCDTKVWSGACDSDDGYLCHECGIIRSLNHEVGHELFPHVVGDYSILH